MKTYTLRCPQCGAKLKLTKEQTTLPTAHCEACQSEVAFPELATKKVVVDHYIHNTGAAAPQAQPHKVLMAIAAVVLTFVGVAMVMLLNDRTRKTPAVRNDVVWAVGGEGVAAGQFRNELSAVYVDAKEHTFVLQSSSAQVKVFNGDGSFLTAWNIPQGLSTTPLGVDLAGRFYFNQYRGGKHQIQRVDGLTGAVTDTLAASPAYEQCQAQSQQNPRVKCPPALYVRPLQTGGVAVVWANDSGFGRSDNNVADRVDLYDAQGVFQRSMGPMIQPYLTGGEGDAASITGRAKIDDVTLDGLGNVYYLIRGADKFDTRAGVYVFDSQGRFLNRVALDRRYFGSILVNGQGHLLYQDVWLPSISVVDRTGKVLDQITTQGYTADPSIGNLWDMAAYPNGDLAVTSSNHKLLRMRLPPKL